ncbi:hypothetical protein [Hymenobacter canadensis]|uniref:Uncharacterized protein n=1 Tax=Hymenobacter canadensis TaxID=2999067 RepID=A0ABY7LYA6_9BACT|nr:hypothetical protein [Hymenobacter canadensis]WBA44377.1 hypothetical protein O3303_21850 [Hymenobacter canadensis]
MLRAYLTHLLTDPRDKALEDVPAPLRASVEAFLLGKTVYHDAADRPIIYAHDLAAWAHQVIHVSGLEYPVSLATIDVDSLRQAMAA